MRRSAAGVKMIEPTLMCAWNWDARPFPAFPALSAVWGDAGNWPAGTWIGGKGPGFPPAMPDSVPVQGAMPTFPALAGQGWSTTYRPLFTTQAAPHVSGREVRAGRVAAPYYEITLAFDVLSDAINADIETLAGFYAGRDAGALPFLMPVAPELGLGGTIVCRFAGDQLDLERFVQNLVTVRCAGPALAETLKDAALAPQTFPQLAGQGWSVHKRPSFATRIAGSCLRPRGAQPLTFSRRSTSSS